MIADGFCYAGTGLLALATAELVGVSSRFDEDFTALWHLVLIGGCLAAALESYDRLAAAGALAYLALAVTTSYGPIRTSLVVFDALPATCFLVMLILPRRGPRRPPRLAWLVPTVGLGLVAGGRGPSSYLLLAPLAIIVPLALARLPRDPRLAIACSLFAATTAMFEIAQAVTHETPPLGIPLTILLGLAAPIVLTRAAKQKPAHSGGGAA